MNANSFGSVYNLPHDQLKFLEKILGITFPDSMKEDKRLGSIEVWKFSGCYPFKSIYLPFNLALKTAQKLKDFGNDVFGLILPYPHGFEGDKSLSMTLSDQKYLHLFNVGTIAQLVSATVDLVAFTNIDVYPKKRTVLTLGIEEG